MGVVSNTVLWLHTVCGYCMYCVLNERLCISLCLSVHSHSLLRSGTVHILHYNLPPALSQWWYSQHFALYYDLHFSHIPPISSQRHHWVPEHLFSPHGYTWVPALSLAKTGFKAITCTVLVEKSSFHLFKPDRNQTSHFLSSPPPYSCWSAVGSTRREGGVPAYVNLSASSMLMIAMQYTSNPGNPSHWLGSTDWNSGCNSNKIIVCFLPVYHCQLLECLMKHKQEVWKVSLVISILSDVALWNIAKATMSRSECLCLKNTALQ